MYKYLKFAILGAFFTPPKAFYVYIICLVCCMVFAHVASGMMKLGDYKEPERYYNINIGFIIENNKLVPKSIWHIDDDGKKHKIPEKNTRIQKRNDSDVYDTYCRIRRKDGTGYDYVHGVMQRVGDEFKSLSVTCGRELGT